MPLPPLNLPVKLGIVPAHIGFAGGVAPGEDGRLPRDADDVIRSVAETRNLLQRTPVHLSCVQLPCFAGTYPADLDEAIDGLTALGLEVHLILFVNGVNPMAAEDENAVVGQLVGLLGPAVQHGIAHVSSTSIEQWMAPGARTLVGAEYAKALAQVVKVHLRAVREAGLEGSCVQHWHIEFLRPGEFSTFSNIRRGRDVVSAANKVLGRPFFKLLVDASHCGDSGLGIQENEEVIAALGSADELGVFHCSAKTTRGCLSTDDGWVGALLAAAARTGKLEYAVVEMFDHTDHALAPLRELDPGHGINTCAGRTYTEVVTDGLLDVGRRLHHLAARGWLAS